MWNRGAPTSAGTKAADCSGEGARPQTPAGRDCPCMPVPTGGTARGDFPFPGRAPAPHKQLAPA